MNTSRETLRDFIGLNVRLAGGRRATQAEVAALRMDVEEFVHTHADSSDDRIKAWAAWFQHRTLPRFSEEDSQGELPPQD